jgi:hypothetical protein
LDYTLAIRRNRDQLRTIVLALFALARMRVGGSLFTLPRSTFAMIMLVLRPAESCVRRLIVIAAHGLVSSTGLRQKATDFPSPLCGAEGGREAWLALVGVGGASASEPLKNSRAFKLFDPLNRFDPEDFWDAEPVWESDFNLEPNHTSTPAVDDKPLNATHIGQRLNALIRALDNLPAQARRLVRYYAKRDAALKASKPTRMSPMRPGLPPGWRERRVHEIDDVLRECHGLAHDRLNELDTS